MLFALGASHRSVDLSVVDQLAGAGRSAAALVAAAQRDGSPLAGVVVLATCNRFEVYGDAYRFHGGVEAAIAAIAQATGRGAAEIAETLHVRAEADAAEHLFRVAAGLESIVIGEPQISGQVADALGDAQRRGVASSVLQLLFQSAARTAKKVANDTGLRASGRSIAAAALDFAERGDDQIRGGTALLIGTGAYARVVTAELRRRDYREVAVFSPSGRAYEFAASHKMIAVEPEQLTGRLAACSVVVSCSGTGAVALPLEIVRSALEKRDSRLPIVDLALRSDVPAPVRELSGVRVVDLAGIADVAPMAPHEAVDEANDIVASAVSAFGEELADRQLAPAVVALRSHVTATIQRELERLLPRIPQDAEAEVRQAAHRLAGALLHAPSAQAHEVARTGDPSEYIRALHTLFGIELPR